MQPAPEERPDPAPARGAVPLRLVTDADSASRRAERRENSLMSLFELSEVLGAARDPFAMSQLALLNVMGHFGAPAGALWAFPDDMPGAAVTLRAYGWGELDPVTIGRRVLELLPHPTVGSELREPGMHDDLRCAGVAVAVPIPSKSGYLGAIALGSRMSDESYEEFDLDYLRTVARILGVALDNARLYQQMAETNRQMRRANQDLVEADRLKGEFVANVNHELRTPLATIVGFLDILSGMEGYNDVQRRALEAMKSQTARITSIVQNLLEYASVSKKKAPVEVEALDVANLLGMYVFERRPGVLRGLRTLDASWAKSLPEAVADRRAIEKVLDLLVDNAVKFTPSGTRIELRAGGAKRGSQSCVCIEVADNGPGIDLELLPRVFEAFRQGDGSSTRTAGGIGLGLALADELVRGMNGVLEAESTPGRGATFRIVIPAKS